MRILRIDEDSSIYVRFKYEIRTAFHHYIIVPMFKIKQTYYNLRYFIPTVIEMRDFDSHYTVVMLVKSLEYLAQGLKEDTVHVNARKCYRRCMTAAGKFRKAYNDTGHIDASLRRLFMSNTMDFRDVPGKRYMELHTEYSSKGREYYEKMFKIINKRIRKSEAELQKDAWNYLHKHINSFWS